MTHSLLTPEQEFVVAHPLGQHARVLAVAGSGKSTTMAHRIRYLVQDCEVRPGSIRVLMFNTLARKQFTAHLSNVGLPENQQPLVHTFHSFSFQIITRLVKCGALPSSTQYWLGDKAELIWLTVKKAITQLERTKAFPPESVDPEEALLAIGLWKGSLIPPERAGSNTNPNLTLVYREFERQRRSANALTFDDFVPLAVDLLESDPSIQLRYCQETAHLIVDEYQDINYGQQRLLELLAGSQADVMVVGDDDQTIYEWRGARPSYILHDFARTFGYKPIQDYRLSRSFRFGPLIAQCAANLIACNTNRAEKPLIAFQPEKKGYIHLLSNVGNPTREIGEQVQAMVQTDGMPPNQIIVLARLYAQLDGLETEFLRRKIPYRIDGQEPFFKRQEINTLLDYIRLAREFNKRLDERSSLWLLNVANKPSRMLSRSLLNQLVSAARLRRLTPEQLFSLAVDESAFGLSGWQADKLADLGGFLELLAQHLHVSTIKAGALLDWMVETLDYLSYFQDYYGKGEHADEKKYAVLNFIRYVTQLSMSPSELLDHLAKLDTTQGKADDELVIFTTIFRTKGLEYDVIVLPECDDNLLPCLRGERTDIYDKAGIVQQAELSSRLESERRLFYVALTRARKSVLIGASQNPSRFLEEIRLKDTEQVMNLLAQFPNGGTSTQHALEQLLGSEEPESCLLNNLLHGYLPDMAQEPMSESFSVDRRLPNHIAAIPV